MSNFVNDAIDNKMKSEVVLYYSNLAFGTADAIRYDEPTSERPFGLLTVHDLKTGVSKPKRDQLVVYCALFCLEYMVDPIATEFICRIYQGHNIDEFRPISQDVQNVMDIIIEFSGILSQI